MFNKVFAATALAALMLALGGCSSIGGFDRSVLTMPPAPAAAAPPATAPAVVIRSVSDERVFEAAPRDPSTPSLGPDGGDASVRARAIGRKRNGYGQAVGDVLLAPGETVEGLMRQHIVAALQQGGVRVIDESAATPETPRIDVHIDRFWAWLHPRMMIHQNTHIEARFVVAGATPVVVMGHYDGEGPMPPDRVWVQMFETALASFRNDLAARAGQAPFVTPAAPGS
jgi:hypothetical protein